MKLFMWRGIMSDPIRLLMVMAETEEEARQTIEKVSERGNTTTAIAGPAADIFGPDDVIQMWSDDVWSWDVKDV